MRNKYLIILFLNFISNLLLSQQYKATIKQYTEKDGLSSNEVLAIAKDTRGVTWIGTKYGLNRFDGKSFKVFTTQNGLFSNHVDELYNDNRNLWLLYKENIAENASIKNIEILDIRTHKVMPLTAYFGQKMPFAWQQVKYCKRIGNDLWFELENQQRFLYNAKRGFEETKHLPNDEQILQFTKNGDCWLTKSYKDSLFLLKRDKTGAQVGNSFAFATTAIRFDSESNNEISYFSIKTKLGDDEKALRIEIPKNAQTYTTFTLKKLESWYANTLFLPQLNLLWYSVGSILAAYTIDKQPVLYNDKDIKLGNSSVRQSFIEDNTIWVCSHAGFYQVELTKNYFYHQFPNLQFRGILSIQNKVYANENNKIFILDKQKYNDNVFIAGLASTLSLDSSLWTAKYQRLYRFYPKQKLTQKYIIPYKEPWAMREDTQGRLWISQNGLIGFDPQTQRIDSVDYSIHKELIYNTIYHFFPYQNHHWYLCATSGLYEFNPQTKQILARHSAESATPFYLPANDFRHLYFDKKENIFWLATGQNGLIRWNPKTNEFENFTFHSITSNLIHAVYADDFGFLWLSTEGGIIQFHKETHQFKIYTTKDGLPTNEFNRISHFQDTDGTLYFGSVNGVVSFHPKNFQSLFHLKTQGTPFVVEALQYIGKTNQLENITSDFEAKKLIYLRPDDRFFTLTMGLKEYEQADAARYFYKLKDEAGDWAEAKSNQITLGRLPYGNQILLVKVLLANGQFAETIAEIPIFVARPFYLQGWFVVLMMVLAIFIFFWRINLLRKRNIQLEQEVARRTEKINEDKIIIAKQATELQQLDELKSRFFANISHELRTPITLILNPLNYLLNTHQWEKDKEKQLLLARKNSQKLLRLVNEILDLTKLEAATLTIEITEIELLGFIQRIVAEFESLAARKNIGIHIENTLQEKIKIAIDVKKVETILYNFITNALKFTPQNGHINIKIFIQNADLQIEVNDTGRGIYTDDLPYIFDRFYQSKTNGTSEGGTGLGLALSRELAQLLRGSVWAVSEWGKGSSFFLKLPDVVLAKTGIINTAISNIQSIEQEEIILEDKEKNEDRHVATSKHKLLLVEDNFDLQDYIASMLSHQYEIVVKDNGKEAFDYLENLTLTEDLPHLIISDVMMPIMDGYQLLSLLKEGIKYQKIPVIMLTARAGLEDKLKALRIGVDDYLTKPFIEIELLTRIENLLKNANLRKQAQQEAITSESADEIPETAEETQTLPSQWLKNVEAMIYENMSKPDFSIEAMSEKLGISRQTFTAHIKKEVGISAMQYLQEVRLQYARNILERKAVANVKTVAEQVGISDIKYFSRLFKARFGRLPSEYLT